MSKPESAIIPLAYRDKVSAAIQFGCWAAFLVCLAAQVGLSIWLARTGDVNVVVAGLQLVQVILSPMLVLTMLDGWRALRGRPSIWIEGNDLVLRFAWTRRIALDRITECKFMGIGGAYNPSTVTLHIRDDKPLTLSFSPHLKPVPEFIDALRCATGEVKAI